MSRNKYKIKYLKEFIGGSTNNQEGSLYSLIDPIIEDIKSLLSEEHILGISIFQTDENIYILIGESHHKLEKDTQKSFARIYKDMIEGKFSINNIDIFIESQINLEPLINSKDLLEYQIKESELTFQALRRLTQFKSNNNLNIIPHYIDIRDNSLYFWLDLAFKSDQKQKNEIISNIFILIVDNYMRYLKELITNIKIENQEKLRNLFEFADKTNQYIYSREEQFEKDKIMTYDELSFLSGSVINPYILAKMYSTDLPIKILYGGASHIEVIDKELKKQKNIKVYFYDFKEL
jgi:hypothetical protein